MPNASAFIKNRKRVTAITSERIQHILWYVAECYTILANSTPHPVYSKSFVADKTTHKFEDFLKFRFVNDYLIPNKFLLQKRVSALEEITFLPETQKNYIDSVDGKEKPDKIDIYINKLGLQQLWRHDDDHIYFAIECKRINASRSYSEYVSDIHKLTTRNHTNLRLPFEGMMGFVEDSSITHEIASAQINEKLKKSKSIITLQYLTRFLFHTIFNASYSSKHQKSFGHKSPFIVYHFFFDLSKFIVD